MSSQFSHLLGVFSFSTIYEAEDENGKFQKLNLPTKYSKYIYFFIMENYPKYSWNFEHAEPHPFSILTGFLDTHAAFNESELVVRVICRCESKSQSSFNQ